MVFYFRAEICSETWYCSLALSFGVSKSVQTLLFLFLQIKISEFRPKC